MGRPPVRRIADGLSELFASAWTLLSDTDAYLSRTSVFHYYESELKQLRADLSSAVRDTSQQRAVRDRIVQLRRALRLQGYDLSLAGFNLEVKGYRNDASLSEGFKRLVIACGSRRISVLTGQENHLRLHAALEESMRKIGDGAGAPTHFLWYRWTRKTLELSGSDSEPEENFNSFREYCGVPENRLRIIQAMKRFV